MNKGDRVRIIKVSPRARAKVGRASPQVGDIGVVRFVVHSEVRELTWCMVDCVQADGSFAWTADFTTDEVEVVE